MDAFANWRIAEIYSELFQYTIAEIFGHADHNGIQHINVVIYQAACYGSKSSQMLSWDH